MKISAKKDTFYLGDQLKNGQPLLYESKNFTTHAVCVGMTGSGKTGLGIGLIEEAALDNIPAIVIDPKGDMVDLLLDAKSSDEKYRQVEKVVYTPASESGLPVSILASFAAPSKELMKDKEAIRERVLSTTSGLLGLIGIKADPIKSREHILISTLIHQAWDEGEDLDIAALIDRVQNPPFDTIGALDTDTFYPPKDRKNLSISLNNLLASPGFAAWMEGDPLDIEKLFYNKEGKAKISVLYIAHLSDAERMFFVTLLLNELIAWMRRQSGTSDLRALLYMDEIFGFFPPTATPPSKLPMLTLLKQARAFGVGIVLATQNPVDLDYKGLSNCGTWFIGKLQTERDKSRLLEGLESPTLDKLLQDTGKRVFILRSVYQKEPILFKTRDTFSDLQGPLTLEQIAKLAPKKKTTAAKKQESTVEGLFGRTSVKNPHYKPYALCETKKLTLLAPITDKGILWEKGQNNPKLSLDKSPPAGSTFDPLPDVNIALSFKQYYCKSDPKRALLEEKVRRAEEKLSELKSKARWRIFDTFISIGSTILRVFTGQKRITKGTIDKAGVSVRRAGKIGKDTEATSQAEESLVICQKQLNDYDISGNPLEIEKISIVWVPDIQSLNA